MKYLPFLLFAGLLHPVMTEAQEIKLLTAPMRVALAAEEDDELPSNQMWYGYYKGNEPIVGIGVGMEGEQYVNNAIKVDGQDPVIKGKKIRGMRFRIQGAGDIDEISGWISTELDKDVKKYQIASVDVDENTVVDQEWTVVMLDEAIDVPESSLYAGYTVHTNGKIHASQFVGLTTNDRIAPDEGALYTYETMFMSAWQWYGGGRYGKLCYQVLLEGDFSDNAIEVDDFGDHYVVKGETTSVPVTFTNMSKKPVESFDYVISTNGVDSDPIHYDLAESFDVFSAQFTVEIPFASDPEAEYAVKELKVVKVNGVPNEAIMENSVGQGGLATLLAAADRKVLLENYTGTWCGWCPRDFVGTEKLKEIYGDDIISIEAHVNMSGYVDVMAIPPYEELQNDSRGYPAGIFNRQFAGNSYSGLYREEIFKSPEVVDAVLATVTPADIAVNCEWADNNKNRINVITDYSFQYSGPNNRYSLGYVLKAGGLEGEGIDWMQTNYYIYNKDDRAFRPGTDLYNDFEFWLNQPDELVPIVYDNVAVAAYGLVSGLPGSIPEEFVASENYTHNYVISVANNELIQDKSKLTVVALLIDNISGMILNAAESDVPDLSGIGNSGITGVEKIEVARYNLMGQPLASPVKGINIVVYSDGSVTKEMVYN